ncbi:DUF397 domain-containing protein [Streptomyces niveus]|uniref:DUF397 domain-containing protein n=1 Tax=Streptomyces niveus TaxID=193462 RepID=UPI0036BE9FC4
MIKAADGDDFPSVGCNCSRTTGRGEHHGGVMMMGDSASITQPDGGRLGRPPVPEPAWRKSSYSNPAGACVEVALWGPQFIAVRDSKVHDGPMVALTRGAAEIFIAAAGRGDLRPAG